MREFGLVESIRLREIGSRAVESLDIGQPDLPAVIGSIALSVDRDALRVAGLAQQEFDALVAAWRVLNGPLFKAAEAIRTVKGKKGKVRWRDIYSTLIAGGHDPQRIAQYTERQIQLYYEGAQRLLVEGRVSRILDFNAAQAGGKHADGVVKKLQKVAE